MTYISGVEIVKKALRIPCFTIANNTGVDAQDVVTRVMQGEHGYDAMNGEFVDMMKTGIIDPTKVHQLLSSGVVTVAVYVCDFMYVVNCYNFVWANESTCDDYTDLYRT